MSRLRFIGVNRAHNNFFSATFLAVLFAIFAVGTADAQRSKATELTKPRHCTKFNTKPPALASEQIAGTCLEEGKDLRATRLDTANAAHNAAKLYMALAERASTSASASNYLNLADEAATLSRSVLTDDGVNEVRRERERVINRYKFSRVAILIQSKIERALMPDPSAAIGCGGDTKCLQDAQSLFDANEAVVLLLAVQNDDAAAQAKANTLKILSARGESRLAELSPDDGGVERALQKLKSVIATDVAGSTHRTKAEIAFADIALLHARKRLASPSSEASARQALSYLNQADQVLANATNTSSNRPEMKLELGNAHSKLAVFRPTPTAVADRNADLCNAATAYQSALAVGGTPLSSTQTIAANVGMGMAYSVLIDSGATCSGLQGETLLDAGLAAFGKAWDLQSTNHSNATRQAYSGLLIKKGLPDKAAAIIGTGLSGSSEQAMENLLQLARLEASKSPEETVPAGSETKAVKYYKDAAKAFSPSPKPDLELGVYYYDRGDSGKAKTALQAAANKGAANAGYTVEEARANHYLSMNEVRKAVPSKKDAIDWAEKAVQGDSTNANYEHQACRAYLMARKKALGNGTAHCSANRRSPEGALLYAMMSLRQGQIARKAKPRETFSAFRPAEDAFTTALDGRPAELTSLVWPSGAHDYSGVAKYGRLIARACGTPRGETAKAPTQAEQDKFGPLFERYGLSRCDTF